MGPICVAEATPPYCKQSEVERPGWGTGIRTPIARARTLRPAVRRSPKGRRRCLRFGQIALRVDGRGRILLLPFLSSRENHALLGTPSARALTTRRATFLEDPHLTTSPAGLRCAPVLATGWGECQPVRPRQGRRRQVPSLRRVERDQSRGIGT